MIDVEAQYLLSSNAKDLIFMSKSPNKSYIRNKLKNPDERIKNLIKT